MKYWHLVWSGMLRKKTRFTLTLLSVLIAFTIFVLLSGFQAVMTGSETEGHYSERLLVLSTGYPLPLSHFEKIKRINGVIPEQFSYYSWFGGYYQEPKNRFFQAAVHPEGFLALEKNYMRLSDEHREAWLSDQVGALVNEEIMQEYNWQVGDRVPLISSSRDKKGGGNDWSFVIRGVMYPKSDSARLPGMVMHYKYVDETRAFHDGVNWFALNVRDPAAATAVAKEIDKQFKNSLYETRTQLYSAAVMSYMSELGNIALMMSMILAAVFFTMLLVTGNNMMQSFRERIQELAVLKTLGFTDSQLLFIVIAESTALVVLGGLVGVLLAWVIMQFLPPDAGNVSLTLMVFLQSVFLMLLMGVMVGLIPAWQAHRLTIIDALRRR